MSKKYYIREKIAKSEYTEYGNSTDLSALLLSPWKSSFSDIRDILVSNAYSNTTNRIYIQKRDRSLIEFYHIDKFMIISGKKVYIGYEEFESLAVAEEECKRNKNRKIIFQLRENNVDLSRR